MNTATQQTAHTPGPWSIATPTGSGDGPHHVYHVRPSGYGEPIADVASRHDYQSTSGGLSDKEIAANARLIAAAPALLEALANLVAAVTVTTTDGHAVGFTANPYTIYSAWSAARDALASTKGGA